MSVIRNKYPSREEVEGFQVVIDEFYALYVTHFGGSGSHYLFFLKDHAADQLSYVYVRWGVGLGFFTTQASEHGNKLAKNALSALVGFTTCEWSKFDMILRDSVLRLLHFIDTIEVINSNIILCTE